MKIKLKYLNKYFIKQYVINNIACEDWISQNYEELIKDNKIVGYIFVKKPAKFNTNSLLLNLYLIKNEYYNKSGISTDTITKDWKDFMNLTTKSNKACSVFQNPPIELWLDSKNNWCKKLAGQISSQFKIPYQEALSDIYYGIMFCYNKKTVYMGSLIYIQKTIYNIILMDLRYNRTRVNQTSGLAISLNTVVEQGSDDSEITLGDMIPAEEKQTEDSLEYKQLYEAALKLLSTTFSVREIEQILTQRSIYLPMPLYKKLLRWRSNHSSEELYEVKL